MNFWGFLMRNIFNFVDNNADICLEKDKTFVGLKRVPIFSGGVAM